jgi:hypothetical protein
MPPPATLVNAIANDLQLSGPAAPRARQVSTPAADFARQGIANHAGPAGAPGKKPFVYKATNRLARPGRPLAEWKAGKTPPAAKTAPDILNKEIRACR